MAEAILRGFMDNKYACWSDIKMASGEKVLVSLARTGILIKKKGFFGAFGGTKLFEASSTTLMRIYTTLSDKIVPTTTKQINNPILQLYTEIALSYSTSEALSEALTLIADKMEDI